MKNSSLKRGGPLKINRLLKNKRNGSRSPARSVSPSSPRKKMKEAAASPAEILFKILRTANVRNDAEEPEPNLTPNPKKTVINNFKCYDYGSGQVKEYERSNFYFALEAFEKVYEAVIKQDLNVNSEKRKFDFQSLLSLIKNHLQKILQQFSAWTEKEKKDVDEIIARAEKSYFAGRLNKLFLSDKQKYKEINVFKRLNEIEVVSLSRLFKQIKFMLLNKKESYNSPVVTKDKKQVMLGLPAPNQVQADLEDAKWLEFIKDPAAEAPPGMSAKQMLMLAPKLFKPEDLEGVEQITQRLQRRLHRAYHKSDRLLQGKGFGIISSEFPNDQQNKRKEESHMRKKFIENGAAVIHRHIRKMIIKALYKFSVMNVKLLRPENKTVSEPVKAEFFKEQAKTKNYDIIILKEESQEFDLSSQSSLENTLDDPDDQADAKVYVKPVNLEFPSHEGLQKMDSEYAKKVNERKKAWDLFKKKHARVSALLGFKSSLAEKPKESATKILKLKQRRASAIKLPELNQAVTSRPVHRRFPSTQFVTGSPEITSLPKSQLPRSPAGTSVPSLSQGLTRVNSMALWSQKPPSSPTLPTIKSKPASKSMLPPKVIGTAGKKQEQESDIFKDHVVGGREITRDKPSNAERKDKDNRRIVEYLNSKFEAANKAFIDILEKHMVEVLSDECLDGIANQNPQCVPEFRKALKHTLIQYLPSAVVLQKDSIKVKEGKILSHRDEKPRETEMFSNFFKLDASNFHVDAHLLQKFKVEQSIKRKFTVSRTAELSAGGVPASSHKGISSRLPAFETTQGQFSSRKLTHQRADAYNKPRLNMYKKLALLD